MEALIRNTRHSITYGRQTIDFTLFPCNRKTMEIAVHPDSTVLVKAPLRSDLALIEKKVVKRARWILKQVNYFKQFTPRTPVRCYVTGETHLYLGKQYRLKPIKGEENSVKLAQGFFHVTCRNHPTPDTVRKLLHRWYTEKAQQQFAQSMERCWKKCNRFGMDKPRLTMKRMRKRWGSLSDKGTVTLNTDLIRAPKECIDYVITHELCHLKHHDHSTGFYRLLDSLIPGWEEVKHKLEVSLV